MKSAWALFLAKTMVLPSRSPPATFSPWVIRFSSTLSTVSVLNSHLFRAAESTASGTLPSSSHSSASHCSFSSSDRSWYLMPSRWNLSGTEMALGGTR
ncbi:MAG: hypothetical protein ACD_23C00638G0001 [uncultured bacterium]|nr:MAG: hypothetical protein ACD_23C00638G0001 [uncultured bacterium]